MPRDQEMTNPYGDNNHTLPPIKEDNVTYPTIPTLFQDLSDEDKGKLLLAHHNKEKIEVWVYDWEPCSNPSFYNGVPYRVKPAPVVEKKRGTMVFHDGVPVEGSWRAEEDIAKMVGDEYI